MVIVSEPAYKIVLVLIRGSIDAELERGSRDAREDDEALRTSVDDDQEVLRYAEVDGDSKVSISMEANEEVPRYAEDDPTASVCGTLLGSSGTGAGSKNGVMGAVGKRAREVFDEEIETADVCVFTRLDGSSAGEAVIMLVGSVLIEVVWISAEELDPDNETISTNPEVDVCVRSLAPSTAPAPPDELGTISLEIYCTFVLVDPGDWVVLATTCVIVSYCVTVMVSVSVTVNV